MRYLGLDVHSTATVYCVLDAGGAVVERGSIATTAAALGELVRRLSTTDELMAAQEVGTQCHFVHDAVSGAGARILSFNAAQLRMIAASRKKTDKRDAFWIAKALQTGMTPHPVHVPSAEVRNLRSLLHQRQALVLERKRWLLRARSYLRSAGVPVSKGAWRITRLLEDALEAPDGLPASVAAGLELCARQQHPLGVELATVEGAMLAEAKSIDAIRRLKTIPAVGDWVAITVYAAVGDIHRFGNARLLAAYAGLVPSVHQSGATLRNGPITKAGSGPLRAVLVQAGHVLLWRCHSADAMPLRALAARVHTARARRKIAVVAAARHILRIAFYVLRDGTTYDPKRIHVELTKEGAAA
jgi:transposase